MKTRPPSKLALRLVPIGVAVLLIAACQATTHESDRANPSDTPTRSSVYPNEKPPGVTDNAITVSLPGVTDKKSLYYESNRPFSVAMKRYVDQLNTDGGITGRQIMPLWNLNGATDETTLLDRVSALCAQSSDSKPFALGMTSLITSREIVPPLQNCTQDTKTIAFLDIAWAPPGQVDKAPYVVMPYAPEPEPAIATLVDQLDARGFFTGARQVAVVNPSGADKSLNDVAANRLDAAGVADPLVIDGQVDPDSPATANALALRLKSENVDRIVLIESDSNVATALGVAMIKQKYTPKLGTLSATGPMNFMRARPGYPAHQVTQISWQPGRYTGEDIAPTQLRQLRNDPASRDCMKAAESTGQQFISTTLGFVLFTCDMLRLMDAAFKASGSDEPTTAAFFDGLSKLENFKSSYAPAVLDFSHGRAGGGQAWLEEGNDKCVCMKTVAGPFPLSRD